MLGCFSLLSHKVVGITRITSVAEHGCLLYPSTTLAQHTLWSQTVSVREAHLKNRKNCRQGLSSFIGMLKTHQNKTRQIFHKCLDFILLTTEM